MEERTEERITVVMCEPGMAAYLTEVKNELTEIQKAVGGYFEDVHLGDAVIICNEEGKINGLRLCRILRDERGEAIDFICGRFFICGVKDGEFVSLNDKMQKKYLKIFSEYPMATTVKTGKQTVSFTDLGGGAKM